MPPLPGQLLGMDVGNVLQLTHSFGYVQKGHVARVRKRVTAQVPMLRPRATKACSSKWRGPQMKE